MFPSRTMRTSDWNKIKEKQSDLHEVLEAEDLVHHLYEKHVFTEDDKERIMHETTRKDKARKLLDILQTKELQEDDVYAVFLSQLRRTQPHLADMLKPPGTARRHKAAGRSIEIIFIFQTLYTISNNLRGKLYTISCYTPNQT